MTNVRDNLHYAVILAEKKSIYHVGYGPRDPGYTEDFNYETYIAFASKEKLLEWIEANRDKKFRVIQATPMKVEVSVSVAVTTTRGVATKDE